MLVNELLRGVEILSDASGLLTVDVADISADSRELPENALFFAYAGTSFDTHDIAVGLLAEGKIAGIVAERALSVPHILVKDSRRAFARACANFFGADEELTLIGVTGTNGKTTTTWIIEKILNTAGIKTIRIGTTGASFAGRHYELDNTTPGPYILHKLLHEAVRLGAEASIMEVSSHALDQGRLGDVVFDVAVFMNLTGDHLDYHKDMESYYQAKKRLFTAPLSRKQVVNIDNDYGKRLFDDAEGEKYSFGINDGDLKAENINIAIDGIHAKLSYRGKSFDVESKLTGEFNLENILAAVMTAFALGISEEAVTKALADMGNIPGRLEKYEYNGITAFVDYAHTDDALKNALLALRAICYGRIITVFGAGGDRDKSKRPRMGKVVQAYSDFIVVTSDNPRTEDQASIIEDILGGMIVNDTVHVEPDREKAIKYAINTAQKGDCILVAGKGHENYQIIGTSKYHFSDGELVRKYLSGSGNAG